MPVKVRLARHGRKRLPFYHIVVTDSRAPRDGKHIERIGSYNPTTTPATIDLDFEKALSWLQKGAKPSDTVRAILSQEGVLMKKHLLEGVKKGAFDEKEAEKRFESWMKDKELKLKADKDQIAESKQDVIKARIEAEAKVNEERKKILAERIAKEEAEKKAAAEEAAKAEETTNEETVAEADAPEEVKIEVEETTTDEAIAPEVAEETKEKSEE
jgi:small subunit ribosomal protein S16